MENFFYNSNHPTTHVNSIGFIVISQATMLEKYSKYCIFYFQFWHFLPIFCPIKETYLVTLYDCKLQSFKNSPKLTFFGIFHKLLSSQNVNVARFAHNVECDFVIDFQTM